MINTCIEYDGGYVATIYLSEDVTACSTSSYRSPFEKFLYFDHYPEPVLDEKQLKIKLNEEYFRGFFVRFAVLPIMARNSSPVTYRSPRDRKVTRQHKTRQVKL